MRIFSNTWIRYGNQQGQEVRRHHTPHAPQLEGYTRHQTPPAVRLGATAERTVVARPELRVCPGRCPDLSPRVGSILSLTSPPLRKWLLMKQN